jgi:hypothetical protein
LLSYLSDSARAAGKTADHLVEMLVSLADSLCWDQTYTAKDFGSGFLERYGWTELIGLRGPIASNRMACGSLLLGPQIEYPLHRHEAEEIYVPLTAQTLWWQSHQSWAYQPPGIRHAMRTEILPLLTLYLWRGGDLVQKSIIHQKLFQSLSLPLKPKF